jgi:hypothetical protein
MPSRHSFTAKMSAQISLWVLLPLTVACSRQPQALASTPIALSTPTQSLSFAPGSNHGGITPTHSMTSSVLPRGTRLVVRLQSSPSSAASRPGDVFSAVLAEPVVIRGETLLSNGALVNGRVVSANASDRPYLQLALSSVQFAGQPVALHTSAVFMKAASRAQSPRETTDRRPAVDSGLASQATASVREPSKAIKFSTGRQLIFWLVQSASLPAQVVPN